MRHARGMLGVVKYVGEVYNLTPWGSVARWGVTTTGSNRHYLFQRLDARGCAIPGESGHPVLKAELSRAVRSALNNGQSWYTAGVVRLAAEGSSNLTPAERSLILSCARRTGSLPPRHRARPSPA